VTWTVFSYVYEISWQGALAERPLWSTLRVRLSMAAAQLSLTAARTDDGFSIKKSGGKTSTGPDIQFTTNYWREPTVNSDTRQLTVLDADNGKLYDVKIERLGEEELSIDGQRIATRHYRLKGKLDVELWFDAQGYLCNKSAKKTAIPPK